MITVFTPSFADEHNSNAQNLTVKEVVSRMDPTRFRVVMLAESNVDPRIAIRPNTKLILWKKHGNTARILWHLVRNVPDVYFFPREGPLDSAFLTARARLGWKTALLTYVVSGGLDPSTGRALLLRAIRESDVIAGNSRQMSETVERLGEHDVQIVYDGIDRRYYHPPAPESGRRLRRVIFAGSFRPSKRADLVIRAAARHPDWEFRLAGMGEEQLACQNLVDELHCHNVVFLGHLNATQLGEEMRRAQVFFFPSEIEGHPQVLGQAAACGLASIARSSYQPDYVVSGVTGLLVSSEDGMNSALGRLLEDPDLIHKMSIAAMQHAEKFDWDLITEQWQDLMELAVARRRAHQSVRAT